VNFDEGELDVVEPTDASNALEDSDSDSSDDSSDATSGDPQEALALTEENREERAEEVREELEHQTEKLAEELREVRKPKQIAKIEERFHEARDELEWDPAERAAEEPAGRLHHSEVDRVPLDTPPLASSFHEHLSALLAHSGTSLSEGQLREAPVCGNDLGCWSTCRCAWHQRCYMKQHRGSHVGVCGATIGLQVLLALLIIVCMKACMMHCKLKLDAQELEDDEQEKDANKSDQSNKQ